MSISYYKLKLFTGILSIILVLCASIASGQAMKNTEENNFHNSIGNGSERIFSSEINNYLSQNINISAEKTSLARVLKYITAKTGVDFSYSSDVIPYKILVSISAHDITVLAALDQIFHDTNIEWLPRNNRQIVLRINNNKVRDIDNTGTVRGSVSDSTNGEALAFGNVILKEIKRGASTDGHGNFRIPGVPGNRTYTLMVSYIGYKTKEISVYVSVGKITDVNVELSPIAVEMRAVEKVGERIIEKNATDIGLQRISIKDLEVLPKGVETDVFRTIQYLPGVQSTGDVSARYYVRGSASNENLVLLNGVTLYNPFHALGIFSVIDPDMINNLEFYKGGFTAEYGGRLSSVLNVITKDGNKKNFGASATSSFLTGKALVEGPVPHGSFLLAGRKSYNTSVLKKFLDNKNAPIDFYDIGFKLNYANPNFIKGGKFVIHGFASQDNLKNNNPQREDINWSNKMIGLRWFQVTDTPLYYEFGLSYSNFDGNVIPNYSKVKPKRNTVDDISLNMNFNYIFETKDELAFGIDVKDVDTRLILQNTIGASSDIGSHGTNISIFGKYKFLRYDNFGADIGARFNVSSLTQSSSNTYLIEPRVSLTYRLFPWLALKGAWGIYSQELTTLSDENEVISLFEPWIISPRYLPVASAIHYTVGLKADFTSTLSLDIQGYYKVLHNIPTINDHKVLPTDNDLLPASGESYGWEFLLNYNNDPVSITASYSLGWAYKHLNDWTYYPRYDTRNQVNLIGVLNLGAGWQFSAMWIFNTGRPFTQSWGYYDKLYYDDLYTEGSLLESYKPFSILADKNLGRLPQYHRLDISLTKSFVFSWIKFDLDASIINVYDRKNIFYFDRNTGRRINMLPILPTATIKIEI